MEHLSAAMALSHAQRHPPSVTASTVSTASSKSSSVTTTATRKALATPLGAGQNWRGKYLRALNISTPEVDVTRKRAALAGAASAMPPPQPQLGRRARSHRALCDSGSRSRPTPLSQRQSSSATEYGFAVKPDLARGRRCHTDPAGLDDKLSAPIQIPSANSAAATHFAGGATLSDITNLDKHPRRRAERRALVKNGGGDNQHDKLLSRATPVPMKGGGISRAPGGGVGGLDVAFSQLQVGERFGTGSSRLRKSGGGFLCDEFVDTTEDDDGERSDSDDDADEDEHDRIFEMEDFGSSSNNDDDDESSGSSRSRSRRQRTASACTSSPSVTSSSRAAALPRFHSVCHLRCPPSNAPELSESFVPPHKLVQRDVFSIGFRDKLKRRPAKI